MFLDINAYDINMQPAVEYLNENYEYCYLESMHYINSCRDITTIITGLSYGLDGLESKLFTGNTINLSMHSQDLYYDYQHIKKAVKNSKNSIKQCIITLGYYSLFYDLSRSSNSWKCMWTYMPLFSDTHNADTNGMEIPVIKEEYEKFYRSFFQENQSFYGRAILREHTTPKVAQRGGWICLDVAERDKVAFELAQKHNKHLVHIDTFNENKAILRDMINFLVENNIRPIITILPVSKEYLKYIDCSYKEILLNVLDEISCNMNIDFVDMNDLDFFTESDILDSDHLNYNGALKATVLLDGVINNLF